MPKFTLVCDHSCDLDTHIVTHTFNSDYLQDVIMNIDMFLKGAGYVYDGELDIINDTPVKTQEPIQNHSDHYYDINRNR